VIEAFQPTVLLNADETFLKFHQSDNRLVVQTGTRRVGTKLALDKEKAGVTMMVTCWFENSEILPPFLIFNGQSLSNPRARLAREWKDHSPAAVRFQRNHWMDAELAIEYLQWIKSLFRRNDKIMLVWDRASQHFTDEVLQKAVELGIKIEFIPEGLTSVLQVCDLLCNRPLKHAIKVKYNSYLTSGNLVRSNNGSVVVTRESLVQWAEEACEDFMVRHAAERTIAHVFEKCGLALGEEAINKHKKHLIELSQEKPYAVLENEMYLNVLAEVMALELAVDEAGE
jgi:hypothetical protein